jgi:hypothetical protein
MAAATLRHTVVLPEPASPVIRPMASSSSRCLTARLGLGEGGGGEQGVGLGGDIEGEGAQGEVAVVHQRSSPSSVSLASSRSRKAEAGGWDAGPLAARVRDERSGFTKQLG